MKLMISNDSHVNGELTVIWRDWDNILPNQTRDDLPKFS